MNREVPPLAPEGRPKTTLSTTGQFTHGGEKIAYRYLPPAHTDGDTTVHFAHANVFHAGDLYFNGIYPFIDYSAGGNIEGMVTDADRMIEAVDRKTKIIPGHGPMSTYDELRSYRDMLADVNERVSKLVRDGKTLEEIQAATARDYHEWNQNENQVYHQYVTENHKRDRDFARTNRRERKDYFKWRHEHPDQDRH